MLLPGRELYNEEIHNLYSLLNIIRVITSRRMRWVEHVALVGEMRRLYKLLVKIPEGARALNRPRCISQVKSKVVSVLN
jgi:hypothetical protein